MDPTPEPHVDWEALGRSLAGEVVRPGSTAYERRYRGFNARYHDLRPRAMVACASPEDVSETLSFLAAQRLPHAVRSGGHCFAGRSSTSGVVVDVAPLRAVSVSAGVATVGAGAPLGDVYEALQRHDVTIPGGTCPLVGIAGLVLGGGLGILGRTHGTTSDHLVAAQVVLADGRIVDCDEGRHEDLFWALRGAGAGNFGVVTSFAFRTVPAPEVTNFHATWSFSHAAAAVTAWQEWAPTGPAQLAASLKVTDAGEADRSPSVDVYGALLGHESDAAELLDQLVVRIGSDPASVSSRLMSYPETRRFWAQLGVDVTGPGADPQQPPPSPYQFAKSEFFRRPLPAEAVGALVAAFSDARAAGQARELDFMPWGGAYNRVRPDATAFVHRQELFQLKHAAVVEPDASAEQKRAAHDWVVRSWGSVHPWGSGRVFQNFADPELADGPGAYYGTNRDRLLTIKARYDPASVFGPLI
ncbi:MAG TPA: FAD-binding oxidoreductase [Acidimicrobiales bacterium]|nr:FAD-binding oxidoreductase [Acidimicrobiales bacterium]